MSFVFLHLLQNVSVNQCHYKALRFPHLYFQTDILPLFHRQKNPFRSQSGPPYICAISNGSIASGKALHSAGSVNNRLIFPCASGIADSPWITLPSSSSAANFISSKVDGKTRPLIDRTLEEAFTADTISPVIAHNAVKNKFPKLCPSRPSPLLNLYLKSLVTKSSSSAKAVIQCLISPGGKIPKDSLSLPELPPSSPTVTIAVRLFVIFLTPLKSIDKPVPPPIATTLGPLFNLRLLYKFSNSTSLFLSSSKSKIERFVFCHPLKKNAAPIITIPHANHSVEILFEILLINCIV